MAVCVFRRVLNLMNVKFWCVLLNFFGNWICLSCLNGLNSFWMLCFVVLNVMFLMIIFVALKFFGIFLVLSLSRLSFFCEFNFSLSVLLLSDDFWRVVKIDFVIMGVLNFIKLKFWLSILFSGSRWVTMWAAMIWLETRCVVAVKCECNFLLVVLKFRFLMNIDIVLLLMVLLVRLFVVFIFVFVLFRVFLVKSFDASATVSVLAFLMLIFEVEVKIFLGVYFK